MPAITLFSLPKAFDGHVGVIQENAIRSWSLLTDCEVILFGDENGMTDVANTIGVRHEVDILKNDKGTPMVSDAFEKARDLSCTSLLAYINADIILDRTFVDAINTIDESGLLNWLAVGQRYDLDIRKPIDYTCDWEKELADMVLQQGVLHGKAGIDFFVFNKDFPVTLPRFSVGRPGWDSWLIYKSRSLKLPIVDITRVTKIVHQNHESAYEQNGAEAVANRKSAGGFYRMGTLRDADWKLVSGRNSDLVLERNWIGVIWSLAVVKFMLAIKRRLYLFLMNKG